MALRVRERAYASYVDAGDRRNAVKVALLLMS